MRIRDRAIWIWHEPEGEGYVLRVRVCRTGDAQPMPAAKCVAPALADDEVEAVLDEVRRLLPGLTMVRD